MNELEEQAKQEAIFNEKCDDILAEADKRGLQLEVIWSAFKHKEEFPTASLLECLQVGADEWDV
jgi:hypothetical protein